MTSAEVQVDGKGRAVAVEAGDRIYDVLVKANKAWGREDLRALYLGPVPVNPNTLVERVFRVDVPFTAQTKHLEWWFFGQSFAAKYEPTILGWLPTMASARMLFRQEGSVDVRSVGGMLKDTPHLLVFAETIEGIIWGRYIAPAITAEWTGDPTQASFLFALENPMGVRAKLPVKGTTNAVKLTERALGSDLFITDEPQRAMFPENYTDPTGHGERLFVTTTRGNVVTKRWEAWVLHLDGGPPPPKPPAPTPSSGGRDSGGGRSCRPQ